MQYIRSKLQIVELCDIKTRIYAQFVKKKYIYLNRSQFIAISKVKYVFV